MFGFGKKKQKQSALQAIADCAYRATWDEGGRSLIAREAEKSARDAGLTDHERAHAALDGFARAAEKALDDDILTPEEEEAVCETADVFGVSQGMFDSSRARDLVYKGKILAALRNGSLAASPEDLSQVPFRLQKTETLRFTIRGAQYRKRNSLGVSQRVVKGTYVRLGGFKSRPVVKEMMADGGVGTLGITDRHLYFHSPGVSSFRVRHDKIVSIEPYSDGVGFMRDNATAKPEAFVTGDGWFLYNVINLASGTG